jgi:hypothetical protein
VPCPSDHIGHLDPRLLPGVSPRRRRRQDWQFQEGDGIYDSSKASCGIPAAPSPMRLVDDGDGVAAVADAEMPVLTAAMVRETLERVRR